MSVETISREDTIARVCHEANKALCEALGDNSQKSWFEAELWQRESALKGVQFAIKNPEVAASAQHDAWMQDKIANGWIYGPVKDADKKQHPCLVAYGDLPPEQQVKDYLFRSIVSAFSMFRVHAVHGD